MPRKNPLPPPDQAIASRLAKLRLSLRLSRQDLANRSGLPPHLIARIELGRMPLRYGEAEQLLPALVPGGAILAPLNPLWVLDGTLPVRLEWPFLLPKHDAIGLDFKTPFSQFALANRKLLAALCKDTPEAELPESWLAPYLMRWDELRVQMAGSEAGAAKLGCLFESSARRLPRQSPMAANLLMRFREAKKRTERKLLTHTSELRNIPAMQMRELLSKVRRLTLARGMKAKLAAALAVPLPRISEWLSGKYEPSGETTLRLLHWVEQQEPQSNKRLRCANTAGAKDPIQ